jgi:hypothetical protein
MARRVADDIKAGLEGAVAIVRGEAAPACVCHAEPLLVWQEGPNHSYVAAGPEFSFSIADRGRTFVVLASLRLRRGQLFRAKHQPRVIGVTRSLHTAKTLCDRHQNKTQS